LYTFISQLGGFKTPVTQTRLRHGRSGFRTAVEARYSSLLHKASFVLVPMQPTTKRISGVFPRS